MAGGRIDTHQHIVPPAYAEWLVAKGMAAGGMPNVEVAGLTIVTGERQLYAATHGLSAYLLNLRTVH